MFERTLLESCLTTTFLYSKLNLLSLKLWLYNFYVQYFKCRCIEGCFSLMFNSPDLLFTNNLRNLPFKPHFSFEFIVKNQLGKIQIL